MKNTPSSLRAIRGTALQELLVSIAIMALLTSLSLDLVIDAGRRFLGPDAERGPGALALEAQRGLARLREDLMQAQRVEAGSSWLWIWQAPPAEADAVIIYNCDSRGLVRIETRLGGKDTDDQQPLVLSPSARAFKVREAAGGYSIRLSLRGAPQQAYFTLTAWAAK